MAKYVLFVEGADAVRVGLGPLLNQQLAGRNPKIIPGGDRDSTIKRFLDEVRQPRFQELKPLLLIDLDGPEATAAIVLTDKKLSAHGTRTFWMIQEMEAWFLAQPNTVDAFFKKPVSTKLPGTKPAEVSDPSDVLTKATKAARAEPYHKGSHPPDLLPRLDLPTLRRQFPDVERLLTVLNT